MFLTGKTSTANDIFMGEDPRKSRESRGRKKSEKFVYSEYDIYAKNLVEIVFVFQNLILEFAYKS